MKLDVTTATAADSAEIAAVRSAAAVELTRVYGSGPWSSATTEKGVLWGMRYGAVLIARSRGTIIATLRLATKKPWAINRTYYAPARRPLYLVDMAVEPASQRKGIGRQLLVAAAAAARKFPADAVWLDAYDAPAGAGPFYAKCGYREVGRATFRGAPLIYFELPL
jgi:GNAT superfamily N-acetyltransferase